MRSGASYSVRGGSLRVRKVIFLVTVKVNQVKKFSLFQFDCPSYGIFQELSNIM